MQPTLPNHWLRAASFFSCFSPANASGLFHLLAWGWLLVLSIALLIATTVQAQTYYPNGITRAGSPTSGTAANQLDLPHSVFVDGAGYVYVADFRNDRVQKFPPNSTSTTNGSTVAGTGTSGSAPNQLTRPTCVFVDREGYIYVADLSNYRIQKFPPNSTAGTAGSTVAGTGTSGSGANELDGIYGLFVDTGGYIYVTDNNNNRIQKFPPTSTAGTAGSTVAGGPTSGSAANELNSPFGVYVDGADNIYVADSRNNRIQKFPPTSTAGTNGSTVAGGNGVGSDANQLKAPLGVCVDGSGNLLVADFNNHRIQQFPPNSTSSTNGITVAGGYGSAANQLYAPRTVFVKGRDLFVADEYNNRIQQFVAPLSLSTSASPNPTCTPTSIASVTASGGYLGLPSDSYSYTWVAPAGIAITAGGSTSAVSVSANSGVTGVQTLTVTLSDMASNTATATVSLTVGAPPANPSLVAGGTLTCAQTAVTLTATTSSAGSFSYAFAGTGLTSPNPTAGTATVAGNGPYSVTITNLTTGCNSSTTTTVQSNTAPPVVSIGASASGLSCGIPSITLTANVQPGVTVGWDDASSAPTRVVSVSGTYGLSATATNGCSATATSLTIGGIGIPLPAVTMVFNNSATVVAGAGTATITVPGTPGQQFQVLGGSSFEYGSVLDRINGFQITQIFFSDNGIFTIQRGGPFTILVRDGTGCSRTVQGEIVVR
ncbi:MAG: hypothetical protein EAZ91_22060 [Cytophagales bacterium]|nr:MAG: hypothetical protein EAZ91_22060 [Cytophagales bacterium]